MPRVSFEAGPCLPSCPFAPVHHPIRAWTQPQHTPPPGTSGFAARAHLLHFTPSNDGLVQHPAFMNAVLVRCLFGVCGLCCLIHVVGCGITFLLLWWKQQLSAQTDWSTVRHASA